MGHNLACEWPSTIPTASSILIFLITQILPGSLTPNIFQLNSLKFHIPPTSRQNEKAEVTPWQREAVLIRMRRLKRSSQIH